MLLVLASWYLVSALLLRCRLNLQPTIWMSVDWPVFWLPRTAPSDLMWLRHISTPQILRSSVLLSNTLPIAIILIKHLLTSVAITAININSMSCHQYQRHNSRLRLRLYKKHRRYHQLRAVTYCDSGWTLPVTFCSSDLRGWGCFVRRTLPQRVSNDPRKTGLDYLILFIQVTIELPPVQVYDH